MFAGKAFVNQMATSNPLTMRLASTFQVPRGLKLHTMTDEARGKPYVLVFGEDYSEYENWIAHVGMPDANASLLRKILGPSGTLIDVGANIGTIAVPLALSGPSVIAIEMNPKNCARLWVAAAANQLARFQIVQAAASDYDGLIVFSGDEAAGHITDGDGTSSVCLRIDTILAQLNPLVSPVALKMDIEGHEATALRGAVESLKRFRPTVMFESILIEGRAPGAAGDAKLFLENLGYELFLIRGEILCPRTSHDVQEGHVADFLAVPLESRATLEARGLCFRPFTRDERLVWVAEMASFPMQSHQRHAAGIVIRWAREDSVQARLAAPIVNDLLALAHLSDLHNELRSILN